MPNIYISNIPAIFILVRRLYVISDLQSIFDFMSHPHSIISFYYMQGQGIPYPGSFSALLQYEKVAIDIFLLHTLVYKRRQNSDALLYLIFFYIISYVFPVPLSFLYSSYSFSIQASFLHSSYSFSIQKLF